MYNTWCSLSGKVYMYMYNCIFATNFKPIYCNHDNYCYCIQFQEKFSEAKSSAKELLEQRRRQKNKESDHPPITVAPSPISSVHSESNATPPGNLPDGSSSASEVEHGEDSHDQRLYCQCTCIIPAVYMTCTVCKKNIVIQSMYCCNKLQDSSDIQEGELLAHQSTVQTVFLVQWV